MPHLSIRLLGPLECTLDEEELAGFESDKVRALLAYLTIERQGPHRREKLAGLLWPDWPEQAARASLRRTLANLRLVIGDRRSSEEGQSVANPPFLHISRQTIQFNPASDAWVDVKAFTSLLEARGSSEQSIHQLEDAVELYRGDFLEGFSIADSAAFEEWALLNRERLRRLVLDALRRLVHAYQQRGDYERALAHAWRQVELDPWQERAQRQLMCLLAFNDQRSAALAQYESCRRLLAEELGVEPAAETTQLCEQIRDGTLPVPSPVWHVPVAPPSFLTREEAAKVERPVFVARGREMAQLTAFLDLALAGQGRVAFVTGEAGSGKTALLQELARRAQDAHPDLVVASGNGNAHTGIGDPYVPFREVLALLSGDVEARWSAGAIAAERGRRLWNTLPLAAQALLQDGPDLIGTFIPGRALVERGKAWVRYAAAADMDWLDSLQQLVERKASAAGAPSLQQTDLFEQYIRVLQSVARLRPLLLLLDDLQWADSGSVSLLFHLGRQLAGQRMLIVGAYRPEEVAPGRDGQRHPLAPVVHEFQRQFGDLTVDLAGSEGRAFVEAWLDSEPNLLGESFRDMLYGQTGGHPLFTIELLRGLQERGDLIHDRNGLWIEGPALDWETLPPKVDGVIAERIGRLPEALQDMLQVASVEGEEFTAEIVAPVLGADERQVVRQLSGELNKQHRLVAASRLQRVAGRRLSRYRFGHILFQKYLYGALDAVERGHLHEAIGNLLEGLYRDRLAAGEAVQFGAQFPPVTEGALQLASHFQAAGMSDKAAEYRLHAGIRAHLLSADDEAMAHLSQSLIILQTLPDSPARAERELTILLAHVHALHAARSFADAEVSHVYARMQQLCEQLGEVPLLLLNGTLWVLHRYELNRAGYEKALELARRILALAPRAEDPLFIASAHLALGWVLVPMGEFAAAREHLDYLIDFCAGQSKDPTWFIDRENLQTALTYASWSLWCLGYPDQALRRNQEALALAQELGHPFSPSYALSAGGAALHFLRRELQSAQERVGAFVQLGGDKGFVLYQATGRFFRGRLQVEAGQTTEGLQCMQDAMDAVRATGTLHGWSQLLACLVAAYLRVSQFEQGLDAVDEALAFVQQTGERWYGSELLRLKGELMRLNGDEASAEASFRQAIEAARRQQAKSWELRATVSLYRLLQAQDRGEEAKPQLAEVYGWFSEGFDTPDLREARALLEGLA